MILDMSRGKPGADQLDLAMGLLECTGYMAEDGTDCRNYGGIDGIPEMKRLFADLMEVDTDEVFVGGNASLTLMYESLLTYTIISGSGYRGVRKILCPSPGYDRHFAMTAYLGLDMIPIPMTIDGPDMDMVRSFMHDPAVAGMWCVPVYSNPQGIVYSDQVIKEIAALRPAAPDFRVLWDNAYIVHSFNGAPPQVANLLRECQKQNNYDMPLMFSSFSKISFPGAGVCAMAASPANLDKMRKHLIMQTIGPDKLNQLRHVKYFKNAGGVKAHMGKLAAVLAPKFDIVLEALEKNLGGKDSDSGSSHIGYSSCGYGSWLKPTGGYFVSFETLPGRAAKTVQLCADAGLILTPAGAAYPYGRDPQDSNIRIAPTFPSLEQLSQAMEIFCEAVKRGAEL